MPCPVAPGWLHLSAAVADERCVRVIVCDDDELVRSVVSGLVTDLGLTVVGECEDEVGALELLERLGPDIAVVDLALRFSSGLDVVRTAWEAGCRVVIFSSFITPDLLNEAPGGPVAVEKPHFDRLAVALEQVANSVTAQSNERRASHRGQRAAKTFAEAVADAEPGDAIVILEPAPDDVRLLDVLGLTAARVTAAQDRSETTSRHLRLLLACAGLGGAQVVVERIAETAAVDLSSWSQRMVVVTDDLSGVEAFDQVRSPTPAP
jgi:DNA-binding NarL/FixJ family response regulator